MVRRRNFSAPPLLETSGGGVAAKPAVGVKRLPIEEDK